MDFKSYSLAVLVFVYHLTMSVTAKPSVKTRKEQEDYLRRYAYMGPSSRDPRIAELKNEDDIFRMAVTKFQMMVGLNATGMVDEETQKMMEMPRCGMPDEDGMGMMARKRKRRYTTSGTRWPKTSLSYRINNFTPDLNQSVVIRDIDAAFKRWSDVTPLRFRRVTWTSEKVDIDIYFYSGDHGDGSPFDGPGRVLAHATYPSPSSGSFAHFDDGELWTFQSGSGTNLLQVAIHEFGHNLGLSHSDVKGAIMAPVYKEYIPNVQLHSDDIRGINYLYGSAVTPRPTVPTQMTRATRGPTPTEICKDSSFDAIFSVGSELHLFKGCQYYKFGWFGIVPGYPKPINQTWPGLPNKIDTAFYSNGSVFFFQCDRVWIYSLRTQQPLNSYTRKISEIFRGIPDNLDAAFIWSSNGRLYFIKDDEYYRVSKFHPTRGGRADPGYPQKMRIWKGLPEKIDAALNYDDRRTYFFSGKNYYRFNDVEMKVDNGYPIPTGSVWLNCPASIAGLEDMMEREVLEAPEQFNPESAANRAPLRIPIKLTLLITLLLMFSD